MVNDSSKIFNELLNKISEICLEDDVALSIRPQEYITDRKKSIVKLNSAYKKTQMRSNHVNFVAPKYYSVGTRTHEYFDQHSRMYKSRPVPCIVA